MNEILFVPQGIMSQDYTLLRDETPIGSIEFAIFGNSGSFTSEGETFDVKSEDIFARSLAVYRQEDRVIEARAEGLLRWTMTVAFAGGAVTLKPSNWAIHEMHVLRDGEDIGRIETSGFWGRKGRAQLPDDLPQPVAAFLIWKTLARWREQQAGAVAATVPH